MKKNILLFGIFFLNFFTANSALQNCKRQTINKEEAQAEFKPLVESNKFDEAQELTQHIEIDYPYPGASNACTLLELSVNEGLEYHAAQIDTSAIIARMQFLTDRGANVNKGGHNEKSLLLKIVRFGRGPCWQEGIQFLLQAHANPLQKDITGESALSCAQERERYDAVTLFVAKSF